ncbi:MAG: MotA/TolQ/ExbB proton channel family protein [bacterium]
MKKAVYAATLACALFMTVAAMGQAKQDGGPGLKPQEPRETLFSLIVKGGVVMFPLGLCSVVGLAIAVERMIGLSHDRIIPPGFIDGLKQAFGSGDDADIAASIRFCAESASPVGRIFEAGLLSLPMGPSGVEKTIEDAGSREVNKLKRSLRGLAIIGSVAPLLGLLGTVYGLISVFQSASAGGMGKADVLAKGIYEALVTTAAGLTIAIPVVLIYQYLISKVEGHVDEMDEMGMVFMASCVNAGQAKPKE